MSSHGTGYIKIKVSNRSFRRTHDDLLNVDQVRIEIIHRQFGLFLVPTFRVCDSNVDGKGESVFLGEGEPRIKRKR